MNEANRIQDRGMNSNCLVWLKMKMFFEKRFRFLKVYKNIVKCPELLRSACWGWSQCQSVLKLASTKTSIESNCYENYTEFYFCIKITVTNWANQILDVFVGKTLQFIR